MTSVSALLHAGRATVAEPMLDAVGRAITEASASALSAALDGLRRLRRIATPEQRPGVDMAIGFVEAVISEEGDRPAEHVPVCNDRCGDGAHFLGGDRIVAVRRCSCGDDECEFDCGRGEGDRTAQHRPGEGDEATECVECGECWPCYAAP